VVRIVGVLKAINWFLAISSGKWGLDGWRMMATDDTGTDLWTVAGAWEERNRPAGLSITHKFQPSKIQKILKN
jgi:hypothetical protein